jgi:hypothetical protein
MIGELVSGISCGIAVLNGGVAFLLYKHYVSLAEESLEFVENVISSLYELDDGSISVDPVSLAGMSMDHLSRVSGVVKWMKIGR